MKQETPIEKLVKLADSLAKAKEEADDTEAELKRKKAIVAHLENDAIPKAMEELELEEFATKTHKIKIEEVVTANITKANQQEAFDWLDDNGHGGMIKRKVVVSFDRDQQDDARKLIEKIRGDYPGVKEEQTLNVQTLRAWVRGELEAGNPIPPSIGYEEIPTAKISKKK